MDGGYFFKFHYQRFLTSTTGWTDEQVGCYLRLLMEQFDKGFIPKNEKKLKRISPKSVKHWNLLSEKFLEQEDDKLINGFMDQVRTLAMQNRIKNQLNGQNGGRPKKNPTLNPNETHIEPNAIPKQNPSETQRLTQTKPIPLTNNHKPYKEEINKEEKFVSELLADQRHLEALMMNWGITQVQIRAMISDFEISQKEKYYSDYHKYRSHFTSWGMKAGRYAEYKNSKIQSIESAAGQSTQEKKASSILKAVEQQLGKASSAGKGN